MTQPPTVLVFSLDQLAPGQSATVVRLSSSGLNRRRMLDLGFLPGTTIKVEIMSPLGDPIAYRVRGALMALRREQAQEIEVTLLEEGRQA